MAVNCQQLIKESKELPDKLRLGQSYVRRPEVPVPARYGATGLRTANQSGLAEITWDSKLQQRVQGVKFLCSNLRSCMRKHRDSSRTGTVEWNCRIAHPLVLSVNASARLESSLLVRSSADLSGKASQQARLFDFRNFWPSAWIAQRQPLMPGPLPPQEACFRLAPRPASRV